MHDPVWFKVTQHVFDVRLHGVLAQRGTPASVNWMFDATRPLPELVAPPPEPELLPELEPLDEPVPDDPPPEPEPPELAPPSPSSSPERPPLLLLLHP
jgi:hypothetical protein